MDRAREALGHPIEIISGREEARLIYLGVAQTSHDDHGRRLVVDIGGGSTEFIIGEDFNILEADSLFMGCVSFSQRFFGGGVLTAKRFEEAQLAAELELQSIARPYQKIGWDRVIGCSGTIHAVDNIVRANGWSTEGITLESLDKLRKTLVDQGSVDGLDIPGLQSDRRTVISGGVAILSALFEDLRVVAMAPSPGALREGVLYDLVGRINREDVRDRTINWFQGHYHVDIEQSVRVEASALTLLEQAAGVWQLDEQRDGRLLSWAACLFEIGLAIAHTGYHKHGAYLVRHSYMAGFSRDEQRVLALLIAGHRRKLKRGLLDASDPQHVERIEKLCVIFRLAVCLNRSRDPKPPACVLKVKQARIQLSFSEGWQAEHPLTFAELEQEAEYLFDLGFELVLHSTASIPPRRDE
jgi:exopolyphosphatase/guanosine-5'-triphosphate,3'-diphosphate pyrophosphatase